MTISLRLNKKLEKRLEAAAQSAGVSKSEFVRRCVQTALEADANRPSPYELAKDLIPPTGSGRGDLAQNSEKYVKDIIRAKADRRRFRTPGRTV
jgi:predicted DNA-binding protein